MITELTTNQVAAQEYVVTRERGPVGLIDRIAPEWQALCAEGVCDEPFYYPAWVLAYLDEFEPGASVILLTVRRHGMLRAVLPLTERSIGAGPFRVRWLRSAANSHFPRFDVIHGAGDGPVVAQVLWSYLERWGGWDLLQFPSSPQAGLAWQILEQASAAGHMTRIHRPEASPYVDISRFPSGVDAIINSLPANWRSKNRRALKRLRSMGEVEYRIIGSQHTSREIQRAIEAFYRLEDSGWKGDANSSIVSDLKTKRFYDRVIAEAQNNHSLAICQLLCDGKQVATKLNLIWNDTMYELKSSYDETYSKCSPGHVIKAFSIDSAAGAGIKVLDNGGRSDPHKLVWTTLSHPFATIFICNKSLRGRVTWMSHFWAGPILRRRLKNMRAPQSLKRMID